MVWTSILGCVACAAIAACGEPSRPVAGGSGSGSGSSPAPVTRPPVKIERSTGTLDAPPIELPKQELFELLDPGRGTRAVLRYQLAAATVEYRAEASFVSRQPGNPPLTLPRIRDGFAITVAPPDRLELRVLPAELADTGDPAARDAGVQYVAAWRRHLEGRRAAVPFDPLGRFGRIAFADDPDDRRGRAPRDDLAQRLLGSIVPVPTEPVATGARWRVITILRQGGIYAKQTASYTLLDRSATAWRIRVELQRVAEQQLVADPALPRDARTELIAMIRKITGDVIIDPRRPVIARGELATESRLHTRLEQAGRPPIELVLEDTGTIALTSSP